MKHLLLLSPILLIVLFIWSNNIVHSENKIQKKANGTQFIGGIQINEPNLGVWAKSLRENGLNTAQVTSYAKQEIWNTENLFWHFSDTTHVINEIRALKKEGLKVVMIPRIYLLHEFKENHFKWHGMIYPRTLEQKKTWFYRYNYFIQMWAKICEREGVDVFSIGSELNSLSSTAVIRELPELWNYYANKSSQINYEERILKHESTLADANIYEFGVPNGEDYNSYINRKVNSNYNWILEVGHLENSNSIERINDDRMFLDSAWRSIILQVRENFNGKVTYAANYDNYNEVAFWDDLDYLGINAYFPLRKITSKFPNSDSLYHQLKKGWKEVFQNINYFKKRNKIVDKPIFFTEIGYTQKMNCTTAPWQGHGFSLLQNQDWDTVVIWKEAQDFRSERKFAIQALQEVVVTDEIPLIGLNYWKLTTIEDHSQIEPFALHLSKSRQDATLNSIVKFSR